MSSLTGKRLVEDLVAVPPMAGSSQGATASPAPDSRLPAGDADRFVEAGWRFVPPEEAGDQGHKVYADDDGHLAVVGGVYNVKFTPETSAGEIESVLASNGLRARRSLGFAKNLLTAESSGAGDADPFALAERLTAHPSVEFAEPEVIETLSQRGA